LTAFVFHFYTPIGTYKDLDLAIAFLRSAGLIVFAPLFLHFSAIYPVRYHLFEERRWRSVLLYIPAFVLLGVATIVFLRDQLIRVLPFASSLLKYSPEFAVRFYKAAFLQFAIALLISLALLIRRFVISKNTVARQQLKWVVWGFVLAIVPFTLFYATGYILGADTAGSLTDIAVLPLILIPLSLGYSVVRYRLMDVELVVRRAAVYALTTVAIAVALGFSSWSVGAATLYGDAAQVVATSTASAADTDAKKVTPSGQEAAMHGDKTSRDIQPDEYTPPPSRERGFWRGVRPAQMVQLRDNAGG
jgi:hypothetical protein